MNEEERTIVGFSRTGNDICSGCGGYTASGERTGNLDIKHFMLHTGRNSAFSVTYCNECAAKVAQFLLDAWKE